MDDSSGATRSGAVPDIDLLIVDERTSALAVIELKWIRKPVKRAEIPVRDAEVLKGSPVSFIGLMADPGPHRCKLGRGRVRLARIVNVEGIPAREVSFKDARVCARRVGSNSV